MQSLDHYIIGECMDMCPEEEISMLSRERENASHFRNYTRHRKTCEPKADKTRVVKSFSRSAAGKATQDPKHLRPPNILLRTVNYLLDDILSRQDTPFIVIYEFIMDRLRSVRQDMVIQNVSSSYFISILQPIIRFHAYAAYRLCEEEINRFDPHINNTHLQECLKRLLYTYNHCDRITQVAEDNVDEFLLENRPGFEALYLILNLGSPIAITRTLNLPRKWRTHAVETALELSICCGNNNFVKACKLIQTLPTLLLMIASLHLPAIRRKALETMSVAYNSKNLSFPVQLLKELLLYDTEEQLISDCRYYGLEVQNNGVYFSKSLFDLKKSTTPQKHCCFVEKN